MINTFRHWAYLMKEWIAFKIGITHGKPRIRSRSHNNSKLSGEYLFFSQLEHIFTIKDLYWSCTHFKGLNMEIQWVCTFLNNFNLLVSKVFTSLLNSKNFLGLCAKNAYKDCNMNSMQNTKTSCTK
jgi:hypothetical protein